MKQAIECIRGKIRENTIRSREIRKAIHEASGKERWNLWEEKRDLGGSTRYWLLALACLRGRPYSSVERKCHTAPHSHSILYCIEAAYRQQQDPPDPRWTTRILDRIFILLGRRPDPEQANPWTEEAVGAWLSGTPTKQEKAA